MAIPHGRVLIVDREPEVAAGMASVLESQGVSCVVARTSEHAMQLVQAGPYDLALVDPNMPGLGGIDLVRVLGQLNRSMLIVVTSGFATVKDAAEVMRAGALDYLPKPVRSEELILVVKRSFERIGEGPARAGEDEGGFAGIIGSSAAKREVFDTIRKVASSNANVLIEGESGTGKELVARAIHAQGRRRAFPFISVHCSAIPTDLLEAELFGHEKGAFTGAVRQRKGKFELADRGTLLLDEVGTLDERAQVDLLRVLQEREFTRIGGSELIRTNARVVATTNEPLRELVEENRFREDLYYRLNVVRIRLAPLREQTEDIPLLVSHLIAKHARANESPPPGIASDALEALMRLPWPGNVRELENAIERAVVLGCGSEIRLEHLPAELFETKPERSPEPAGTEGEDDLRLEVRVGELECELITRALRLSRGNRMRAAQRLGITDRTLRYKLRKYAIAAPRSRSETDASGGAR